MNTIKKFVHNERDVDSFLNMKTLERLLPIFLDCYTLNYLRNGYFYYLDLLKRAKMSHPELYDATIEMIVVVERIPRSSY